jgi:heme/copper-type cytochrome/quinol oxidase subunit 4
MGSFAPFLTGFGLIGLLGVFVLGGTILAILPIWAIIDCSNSKRDQNSKTITIIFLCLTWGLGSLIYSVFLAESKQLRRFSLVSIFCFFGLFILSFGSCLFGAKRGMQLQQKLAIEKKAEEDKFIQGLRARGFSNTLKGQSLSIEKTITEPTIFEAQTFKLLGDSTSDLYVKAQTCEIFGTVGGNLIFRGQVLTIHPKAVIKGNLDANAQVLKRHGKIMGNITGDIQVQEE